MEGWLRIVDPCAPRSYASLADMRGLGGTEATVLRIAQGLAPDKRVTVEQAARRVSEIAGGVWFEPTDLRKQAGRIIIVINSWKVALMCRRANPDATIFVWQHVVPGRHNRVMADDLARAGISILCVSQSLAAAVGGMLSGKVRVAVIYNPIGDDLHPDATPRDPDLLFFASSPHKGLDQVARAFVTLRKTVPGLRLEMADPGYLKRDNGAMPDGAVSLGTLEHSEVIARMRKALCVFCPQNRFAETFGLVIAEANAVGCPALVHRGLGANDEVTSSAEQCIDTTDAAAIAERILAWRALPPKVSLRPEFRLASVLGDWLGLLADMEHARAEPFLYASEKAGHDWMQVAE